jgi:hypothetical protein
MSHFITVPTNANGIIFDPTMTSVVATAMADSPFGFEDVYVYSHGWATDANQSMDTYSRFSLELARQILILGALEPAQFTAPPRNSLGIGIHWPSEITEDPDSPLNALELFTFYSMEQRADNIGRNAVYAMLRLILTARAASTMKLRLFLLGHSFGCKVLCAALEDLSADIADGTIPTPANYQLRVVLLEPATDNDNLEAGDIYGSLATMQNIRILMTKSSLDAALGIWFPAAARAVNLFGAERYALGAVGPTQTTTAQFPGGHESISVAPGFVAADMAEVSSQLVVADLTPIHQARKAAGSYSGGFSGSHSDIFFDELYYMLAGFFFH